MEKVAVKAGRDLHKGGRQKSKNKAAVKKTKNFSSRIEEGQGLVGSLTKPEKTPVNNLAEAGGEIYRSQMTGAIYGTSYQKGKNCISLNSHKPTKIKKAGQEIGE